MSIELITPEIAAVLLGHKPMKHYVSFTSILFGLHNNKSITLEELGRLDAQLAFGCAKEHVLGNYIPCEVTWLKGNVSKYDTESVTESDLTPESLALWNEFRAIIEKADSESRVSYRIGNYPAYCVARIREGVPVWWIEWKKPEDYVYDLADEPTIVE